MTLYEDNDIMPLTGDDDMNWFRKFMTGRYGPDELSFAFMLLFLVFWILSIFFPSTIWFVLELLCIVLCYFRMFSKNYFKRSQENAKFLRFYDPIRFKLRRSKKRMQDKKTYKFYSCPNCKQELRVPKGKGDISITCPKCKTKFDKRT